ncbi:MAG: V-type ATP synthase subunit I [Clostridiaceae bacterium]|jgi:V/A-type H+-transporting ATPase subunit I|nr:V-type ATP synthase subunit I [Clostridiaceae bacterium]
MNKITLLGVEEQREQLINSLMEFGAVEIGSVSDQDYGKIASHPEVREDLSRIDNKLLDVQATLNILDRYCPEKKPLFSTKRPVDIAEVREINSEKERIFSDVYKIREYEHALIELKAEENRVNNLYRSLLPWKDLTLPVDFPGTKRTGFTAGTIPAAVGWDLIESEVPEKAPLCQIFRINTDKDQHYAYIIYHREAEQETLSYLKSRGFNRTTFGSLSGTVDKNLKQIEINLEQIAKKREEIIDKIRDMRGSRNSIEILYDILSMERSRIEAVEKVVKTNKVFLIKGWLPEKLSDSAKNYLESNYTVSVEIEEPAEDEAFPVLLENRGLAEAGEPVLRMYSLPDSREIDPSKIMTPFFVIFFGLMLSDGGYGVILAILAAIILWRFKLQDSTRKFMKLMFFCGLSTMFWGLMFGGWFGISALVPYALWFDMVSNPELMLSWSLLFGVIHMYVGLGLKAANLIRRRKYLDALFDVGFWYVFFTGAVLTLLPYAPAINQEKAVQISSVGKYLLAAGAVLLILTQGRAKKGIIKKFFSGLSSLYDLIGFLSDILSYSRLLALGLATSIIAGIVNQMSVMFDIPVVLKVFIAAAILLIGHAINFGINVLGAYVHSCRLQYLEFFGKFFTGGGEPFSPLKANTKYIQLKYDAEM